MLDSSESDLCQECIYNLTSGAPSLTVAMMTSGPYLSMSALGIHIPHYVIPKRTRGVLTESSRHGDAGFFLMGT